MDEELLDQEYIRNEPDDIGLDEFQKTIPLSGMYDNWFLDYASYVILERAVPDVKDGLKPVQRRILHSMNELEDGRYNKVANIIGNTMKYHPHGDTSIGDALVQMGQKDLLIDCQGNWGNILTGDNAAASRYIEARLSKFALEVLFNAKTTQWQNSYDGRNKEPIALPAKFPILLAQGVEGIAVGLASKILPHNFIELIDASVKILKNEDFEIFPDFITGGMADISRYNDGLRGGRIRVRAKISQRDKKMLVVSEIPFGTTTSTLIDSIISANDKGKIKIKKIEDNTAENVEILIHLNPGVSPDQTIDALYAFTNCEMSISPNACVIDEGRPVFIGVKEILRKSVQNTLNLLQLELEIALNELMEQWHFSSLEKIFIEKRIYRKIEECDTWEAVIEAIYSGLKPYFKLFKREITRDDILRLTEIKIKRISKFDSFKTDDLIKSIEEEIEKVKFNLEHLVDYAISYCLMIKTKFGKGRERKTELRNFEVIEAAAVAATNVKLYVNRIEGFAGTSLRKDEFVCDCSDIDDIIVFRDDGTFIITKVTEKVFVGKNIIHIDVFKKNDERTIYNLIYRDGKSGANMVKRFAVVGVTRDKEYDLTKGNAGSKVLYFTSNPNGEAEIVKVKLRPKPKLKKLAFEFDFSQMTIKGRNSIGNILSKNPIAKVYLKEDGISTLGARDIWFDESVKRLNTERRGKYLGAFKGEDKIISIYKTGEYKVINFDLSSHFDDGLILINKFDSETIWTVVYFDGNTRFYYVKRFKFEATEKKVSFILEHPDSSLTLITKIPLPVVKVIFDPDKAPKNRGSDVIQLAEFIDEKGVKAKGKRLSNFGIAKVNLFETGDNEIETEITTIEETNDNKPIIEMMEVLDGNSEQDPQEIAEGISNISVKPLIQNVVKIGFENDILAIQPSLIEDFDLKETSILTEEKKFAKKRPGIESKKVSMNNDEPLQMELDF